MRSSFFVPYSSSQNIEWTYLFILEFLLFNVLFGVISLLEFGVKKKLFYGPKENPSFVKAIYWGLTVGMLFLFVINMHIFHIINWTISSIISIIIIVILFFMGVL